MRTTERPAEHPAAAPPDQPRPPGTAARAWIAIGLIPVFFFIAMGVGEGLMSLLGYPVGGAAPAWVKSGQPLALTAATAARYASCSALSRLITSRCMV